MRKLLLILFVITSSKALAGRPVMDSLANQVKIWSKKPASVQRDTMLVTAWWKYTYHSIYFHEKNTQQRLDSLEKITKKIKWKVGEGMILINKSFYASYFQNNFSRGLELALKAQDILEKTRNYEAIATVKVRIASIMLWNIQNIAISKNEFLNKGMKISEEIHALGRRTNNDEIKCLGLIYKANFLNTSGKYKLALNDLKAAEKLMQENQMEYLTKNLVLGMLSTTYNVLQDRKNALSYTDITLKLAEQQQDYYSLLSIYRFKAEHESLKLNFTKSLEYLDKSYEYAKKFGVTKFISMAEGYLYGFYKFKNNKEKALEFLEKYKAHEDSLASDKTQKIYADYDLATKQSQIQKLENQRLLDEKFSQEKELAYLKIFKAKEDSIFTQKNEKIQSDYNLALKETKIKALENENLVTQANRNQLIRNILILSLAAGLVFALYFFRNNKKLRAKNRQIKAALLEGQTIERKRVAQELHDNLSAKISGIRWRLESIQPRFETEKQDHIYNSTINALAEVYTDVRLISHNLLPEELETKGLKTAIEKLVDELNSLGKTHFKNNTSETLGRFESKIEYEVFSMLLEVSNNILKHSQATVAIVSLEKVQNNLYIKIADNGVGLPENSEKKGMGMPNLRSRVASLKGKIEFINKGGLSVEMSIPV
ncbi:MAG: hypothetical protein KA188_03380 [Leadbetterella sp.]|nr:hypothetical protein [Leadbetterella sp.]